MTSTKSNWQQILTSLSLQRLKKNERKKKTNDADVGQNSLMNLEAKPSTIDNDFFTYLSCVARLCKQLEEGL